MLGASQSLGLPKTIPCLRYDEYGYVKDYRSTKFKMDELRDNANMRIGYGRGMKAKQRRR